MDRVNLAVQAYDFFPLTASDLLSTIYHILISTTSLRNKIFSVIRLLILRLFFLYYSFDDTVLLLYLYLYIAILCLVGFFCHFAFLPF